MPFGAGEIGVIVGERMLSASRSNSVTTEMTRPSTSLSHAFPLHVRNESIVAKMRCIAGRSTVDAIADRLLSELRPAT